MKIKDLLTTEKKENKKLALEQVLNLSKPELLLNKEKELTPKEYQKYQRILCKQKYPNSKTRNRIPSRRNT